MNLPLFIFIAGTALTAIGVAWLEIDRSNSEKDRMALTRDIAAHAGNKPLLEELIATRTQLLDAKRQYSSDLIKDIFKDLPALTEQEIKLRQDSAKADGQIADDFRNVWEPFIRSTVSELTSLVDDLHKNDGRVVVSRDDTFRIVETAKGITDPRSGTHRNPYFGVRKASLNGVVFAADFWNASINHDYSPPRVEAATLVISISHDGTADTAFQINMGTEQGECAAPLTKQPGFQFAAPKDGIPPQSVIDSLKAGLAKGVERFLTLANANAE